jgi:hypothetical protein
VFLLFPPSEHRAQCYALLDKYAPEIVRQTGVQHALAAKAVSLGAVIGHSGFVSVGISLSRCWLLAWVSFFECIPRSWIAFHAPTAFALKQQKRLSGGAGERKKEMDVYAKKTPSGTK